MESPRFTDLKLTRNKKLLKYRSQNEIKFPMLKIKFGPQTPIHPFMNTLSSFSSSRGMKSHSPIPYPPGSDKSRSVSPSNFLEELISKYENNTINHADIVSKYVKSEEIHVYWNRIRISGYIPDSRSWATLNIVNRNLYIFGGEKSDDSVDIKKLDFRSMSWSRVYPTNTNPSEIPTVKSGHTSVVFRNSLVIFGGFDSFDPVFQTRNCQSLVYNFDLITNKWKSFKPTGHVPEARRNHCGVIVGNSFIIYSGLNNKGDVLNSLALLNLDSMHWENPYIRGDIPVPRKGSTLSAVFHPSLAEYANFDVFSVPRNHDIVFTKQTSGLYLFGGLSPSGKALNDLYVLKGQRSRIRPGTNELIWTKVIPGGKEPVSRYNHCACLCTTFLVIFGGKNDSVNGRILNDIVILRISTWRWEGVVIHNEGVTGRVGAACGVVGSRVLLFGGMNKSGFAASTLYELEVDQRKVIEMFGLKRDVVNVD